MVPFTMICTSLSPSGPALLVFGKFQRWVLLQISCACDIFYIFFDDVFMSDARDREQLARNNITHILSIHDTAAPILQVSIFRQPKGGSGPLPICGYMWVGHPMGGTRVVLTWCLPGAFVHYVIVVFKVRFCALSFWHADGESPELFSVLACWNLFLNCYSLNVD